MQEFHVQSHESMLCEILMFAEFDLTGKSSENVSKDRMFAECCVTC